MNTKLFLRMKMLPHDEVIKTFVAYQRSENGSAEKGRAALIEQGHEEVEHDGLLLPDGREVFAMWGKRWALRPEVHAERMAQALEQARERDALIAAQKPNTAETKSVAGTDAISALVCPKCGDSLQHTRVCPACAAGKLGYKHRYTCVCGGVDLVSKEAL